MDYYSESKKFVFKIIMIILLSRVAVFFLSLTAKPNIILMNIISIFLICILSFFIYKTKKWAKIIITILVLLFTIMGSLTIIYTMLIKILLNYVFEGYKFKIITIIIITILNLYCFLCLKYSTKINYFFDYHKIIKEEEDLNQN